MCNNTDLNRFTQRLVFHARYRNILSVEKATKVVSSTTIRGDMVWTQGSWNMKISGETHVMIKVYDSYTVKELTYYDVGSTTITVIDAIKSAINSIVDIFSKLL